MRRKRNRKKKIIIFVTLGVSLLTMSNAYALWSDSVDVGVSLQNALVRMDYVGRNTSATSITYTTQGTGAPSTGNPYADIDESLTGLVYGTNVTVTYTIQNTGEVPLYFTELDVDNFALSGSSGIYDTVRIQYALVNSNVGYSSTVTVSPNGGHDGVAFANASTQNLLQAGQSCTLTVTYYRVAYSGGGFFAFIYNYWMSANITKADTPVYIFAN